MILKNLSIKSYALGFILLYILIFVISSGIAFWDVNKLREKIIQTNFEDGKTELNEAISVLFNQSKQLTDKFAAWDEVRQQIDKPEYYLYWRTHRLTSSRILPEYYKDVSVYNKEGKILKFISTSSLPSQLNLSNLKSYFIVEKNIPELITISAIIDGNVKNKILGYIATRSDVMSPLLKVMQFKYIDSQSIKISETVNKIIKKSELINYLTFTIKQNDDLFLVAELLNKSLIRNTVALSIFAVVFYFLLSYFFSRPLTKISTYIDTLNNQPEFQYVPKLKIRCYISELLKILHSLTQYQNKLQIVYSNLDDKNNELWDMAHHDALTGALNRRAFEEKWAKVAELFSESRSDVSLILFDVNNFKSINDSYGHPVGDEVLKEFAHALQQTLRKGEKLYRIGGDEFACILFNIDHENAFFAAQRCRQAISDISFIKQGIKEPVRASIGIAHSNYNDTDTESISDLLWQADAAVYHAKKPGNNYLVTYTEKIKSLSSGMLSNKINNIVFEAIETGKGIEMHYQPIINLSNNSIGYYEALLRVKSENEFIPLGEVFELIEAKKLDYELDVAIFKQIVYDFERSIIPAGSGVSINVSGPAIIHNKIIKQLSAFVPFLSQFKIVLEITETSLITNINQATENINKLKSHGFLIALDDFGSGYSSISYLSSMPVDIVKFDISLIRQLANDKQLSIISHLVKMIRETGHLLVAEGIETEETNEIIKQLGFDFAQGFLYGKPSKFT
jgi:diguanylate cyclase (GGDEF)-like protein